MINIVVRIYDCVPGKRFISGPAKVDPYASIKDIKNGLLEGLDINNLELYTLVIVPTNENGNFDSAITNNCVVEIYKK
jgi:hypothetical protein